LRAWTLHSSGDLSAAGVMLGREEGAGAVELALVDVVPFTAASMMTKRLKIAITADQAGCR
jgi:hypothetical protein